MTSLIAKIQERHYSFISIFKDHPYFFSKIPYLRSFLVYGVFLNTFFWVMGQRIYMVRPPFNFDYLLVGCLSCVLSAWEMTLLIAIVFLNDIIVNIAPVYHFQLVDLFRFSPDLVRIDARYVTPLAALFVTLSCIFAGMSARLARNSTKKMEVSVFLFLSCLGLLGVKAFSGTLPIQIPSRYAFLNINIGNSGLFRTFSSFKSLSEPDNLTSTPLGSAQAATSSLFKELSSLNGVKKNENIVLVLVESLGWFKDSLLRNQLMEPFQSAELQKKYKIEFGNIPFEGSTINGEFRELCGSRLLSFGMGGFPKCLPKMLAESGFETVGIHGFGNQMYNRYRWYPKLGFDKIYFAQNARDMGLNRICGRVFKGLCDQDVAKFIERSLSNTSSKSKFIYWLTLNSHLPIDTKAPQLSSFDCSRDSITREDETLCGHTRLIDSVLSSVAKVASNPLLSPTRWIIVGDHLPPFMEIEKRGFYVPGRVPFVILSPK